MSPRLFPCAAFAALLACSSLSQAAPIDVLPDHNSYQRVASNFPADGNVWTGVAQSFTADDINVAFGFYLFEEFYRRPETVTFTLYGGDGNYAQPLARTSVTFEGGSLAQPVLVMADFSAVTLITKGHYTVTLTLPGPALPTNGPANVSVAFTDPNQSYADGRFYFIGSDLPPETGARLDLAFHVASVPEPGTLALSAAGLLAVATSRRVRACGCRRS